MKLLTNYLDHLFLELIKKADHVVVEKANKEEYISPYTMSFNGFLTINEFNKKLSFEFDNYYYLVESEINTIQLKADRIKFLNKIIKYLEEINECSFKIKDHNNIQHLDYKFKDEFSQKFISEKSPLDYYNYLESQHDFLKKCIERFKQEKQDLENLTQKDIDRTFGTSSGDISKCIGINKIKTSLTVQELALFFKILEEAELFIPENKGDWGKVVVELFKTDRMNSISYKSFMNEYYKKFDEQEKVGDRFLLKFEKLEKFIQEHLR